jgi:carbon starvation protein CstA
MEKEHLGRPVFYGSMITEGIVALVWATVSSWFFYNEGWRELCPDAFLAQTDKTVTQFFSAPKVVMEVCKGWLGVAGGVVAVLGVVAAPITSGDTALRSSRLVIADALNMNQKPISKRLMISLPLFLVTFVLLVWQMDNPDSFNTIWKYFGWANQTLSVFTLWSITVYLALKKRMYFITLLPAMFMTFVCTTFLVSSNVAMGLDINYGYFAGLMMTLFFAILFFRWHHYKFLLHYKYNNKINS